jgi:NAD(P)-dependent dehydrogenase (short-subunit alcohol dehydrogenase family)
MSFLGLEGYHVFISGATGGIGGQAVKEFLGQFALHQHSAVHLSLV